MYDSLLKSHYQIIMKLGRRGRGERQQGESPAWGIAYRDYNQIKLIHQFIVLVNYSKLATQRKLLNQEETANLEHITYRPPYPVSINYNTINNIPPSPFSPPYLVGDPGGYLMDNIILIAMLRRELGLTEKINEKPSDQLSSDPKTKNKIASLAPYIAQIQRRKRLRSTNKRSNKNLNQSSSKSFRIKEKSVTSLHKELSSKQRDPPNLIIKKFQEQIAKERRTRSVQRNHDQDISRTIESKPPTQKQNNNFFNDLYARVKSKMERERPSRKRQHETLDQHRTRSQQAGQLNMYKISYTNMTGMPSEGRRQGDLDSKKRTENPPKKTNFRRNKYQVLQSSVGEQQPSRVNLQKQQFLSDGKIVLDKKQSNLTINIEMDRLAERQMESFYQQVITKEIHRSIEKSTEKYFNSESYRPTKSKNQIQVYLSTLINPNLNKISKSTNQRSDYRKEKNNDYLDYDFDFRNEEEESPAINEQNQEEDSTVQLKKEISDFQRQRKKVEVEFFNKPDPHLDWSEDQCKIDEI